MPYPRYAELLRKRGGSGQRARRRARGATLQTADLRDLQVWHKLAWIDPFYLDADPRVAGPARRRAADFTEDDKPILREVELEILNAGDPGVPAAPRRAARSSSRPRRSITRSCRCCATPTSTCARTRTRGCRGSASAIPRTRAEQLRTAVEYHDAAVRRAARAGCGRRKARSPTRWCRSSRAAGIRVDGDRRADPRAHARHRVHARRPRPRRSSPRRCIAPYRGPAGGARGRVRVPRPRAVGPDRLHLRGLGRRRRGGGLRRSAGRGGPPVREPDRAAERRSSPSSSTARTPGSTSRAAAARSCARSTARCRRIRSSGRSPMARGVRRRARRR